MALVHRIVRHYREAPDPTATIVIHGMLAFLGAVILYGAIAGAIGG